MISEAVEKATSPLHDMHDKKRPSITVDGNQLIDESGNPLHLHGVSIMGMEYTAVGGWSPQDPYPSITETTWSALKQWNINSIRIPLNEISYLGRPCVFPFTGPAFKKKGRVSDPDPGHNYKKRLREVVRRATDEGFYVILDLHTTAPDDPKNAVDGVSSQCAYELNPLPDAAHSIDFWTQLANEYKEFRNVMFELFNNPYIDQWPYFKGSKSAAWEAWKNGVTVDSYLPLWRTPEKHLWQSAGMQQLVDAVRTTGARNVLLLGGISRAANLDQWLKYKPTDPVNQFVASAHIIKSKNPQNNIACFREAISSCNGHLFADINNIVSAGYPVVITEFADENVDGKFSSPFVEQLLTKLDALQLSYLAWSFTTSGTVEKTVGQYDLIKDAKGTPTPSYGQSVNAHYNCLAQTKDKCRYASAVESEHIEALHSTNQQLKQIPRGWMPFTTPL